MKGERTTLFLILAACCLLFLTGLGARDFWAPDEGDFAQIVKELDNDLVVPHLNNTAYGEKPPFFYYAVFAFAKTFPFLPDETSMRLASAIAALATIMALFFVVLRSFGLQRAVISCAILALSPLFYWQARYLQVDMVFSAALVLALLSFFRFTQGGRAAYYYLFFVLLAFAFMTKGPLAVALAVPAALFYCASEKKLSLLATKHTWAGLILFLAIVVPWYLAVYFREGLPYLYENILRQNFLRFFDAWSHKRPFYYYFTTLPLDFFPWSLFLPMGLYAAIRGWGGDRRMRFFTIWFFWLFFFLSLSSGKISKYMLPALPALAVIASGCITDEKIRYNKIAYPLLGTVLCAMGIILFVYRPSLYSEFRTERIVIGSLGLACGILVFVSVGIRRVRTAFACIAVFMALAYMAGNISIFGKWNLYKSPKPLCVKIRALTGDNIPWVYYGSMRGVYVYYTRKFAVHIDEHDTTRLKSYAGSEKEFFLLTRERDAKEVESSVPGIRLKLEQRVGETDMALFHYTRERDG